MTEKRYTKQIDRVADTIINIQKDGKDFAWFLLDDYTNDEVDKVIEELNHLHEQKQICRKQQFRQANSIHQLLKEKELLKSQVNEMIELFIDSGLDYHISDELDEILYEDEDWDND